MVFWVDSKQIASVAKQCYSVPIPSVPRANNAGQKSIFHTGIMAWNSLSSRFYGKRWILNGDLDSFYSSFVSHLFVFHVMSSPS